MNLTAKDLGKYIAESEISAKILLLEEPTPTVLAAAAVLGVTPEQILKSVLFLADKEPVIVVANGLSRLNSKALADYLGVSRRRVKIGNAEKVLAITGYVAGSVPPFGYVQPLRTIVETAVTELPYADVYGGGGDINALMKLTVAELQRVVGTETAVLKE